MKGVRVCLPTAVVPTAGKTHTSPDKRHEARFERSVSLVCESEWIFPLGVSPVRGNKRYDRK